MLARVLINGLRIEKDPATPIEVLNIESETQNKQAEPNLLVWLGCIKNKETTISFFFFQPKIIKIRIKLPLR